MKKDTMEKTIKEVEATKIEAGVKIEMKGPYWLTRDKRNGVLSEIIEVWLVKPDLCRFDDGDVMWLPNLNFVDSETTHFAEWTLDQCRKECYVVPETERECIVVGK
jgi:hypothetical protein